MTDVKPMFQLRKDILNDETTGTSAIENVDSGNEESMIYQQVGDQTKVLTENDKYLVKCINSFNAEQLPIPSHVPFYSTIDGVNKQCSYNDNENLYVWNFINSKWDDSNYCKIPLNTDSSSSVNALPKSVFILPTNYDTDAEMLGLENSNSSNGIVGGVILVENTADATYLVYYEDMRSINHLSTSISKNMAHLLDLKLHSEEKVTLMLNSEPAGLVLATTEGRLMFITIRETNGKPCLTLKQQLIRPKGSGPLAFLSLFSSSNEIISLRNGPIIGKGERIVYVLTRNGCFQVWKLSVASKCVKMMDTNFYDSILDDLVELYPFAQGSLKILDTHPITNQPFSPQVVLTQISSSDETNFILSTIILDEQTNSFTIFSTYRLNTYIMKGNSALAKPKLCVPSSLQSATSKYFDLFIVFDKAVVITQTSSKLDSTYTLKRKWEDIISFNKEIQILAESNDASTVYLLTKGMGIISIIPKKERGETAYEESFVKSHLDQAIYFSSSSSNPVEFNLPGGLHLEQDEVENDLKTASEEILLSSSKYIPPLTDNIEKHLSLRLVYFRNLISFVKDNFAFSISPSKKLDIIENFELLNCFHKFNNFISSSNFELKSFWDRTLEANGNINEIELAVEKIHRFPDLFSTYLNTIIKELPSKSYTFKLTLADLIIETIYDAILEEGEKKLRYEFLSLDPLELNTHLPWFISIDILDSINQLFFDLKFSLEGQEKNANTQLLVIVKTLYYLFNQVRLFFLKENNMNDVSAQDFMKKCDQLYENNHLAWNQTLCELGLNEDSLEISEFYHDFVSLVETLDTLEAVESKALYEEYFARFGEQFAHTLFEYYVKKSKLQDLFYRFPEQQEFLVSFFKKYPQYGRVSWIFSIINYDYASAAATLYDITSGDRASAMTLESAQLYLNIAKLSTLAAHENHANVNLLGALKRIQANLDVVDGGKDLVEKLKRVDGAPSHLQANYKGTEFEKLFDLLVKKVTNGTMLQFVEVVILYSLIDDKECLYHALKLLAIDGDILELELKKFLISLIWRRSILFDIQNAYDTTSEDSTLHFVLKQYLEDELFRANCPLPTVGVLTEKTMFTESLLSSLFSNYELDTKKLQDILEKEYNTVESTAVDIEKRIIETISSLDKANDNSYTVNYHDLTIEYQN